MNTQAAEIKRDKWHIDLDEKSCKRIIVRAIVGVVLWTTFLLLFYYIGQGNRSIRPHLVASFLLNGALFYGMMLFSLKKRAFSIDLIHAFFLFSFMFFAPMVQYLKGEWCWETSFSDERILITNLLLDLWAIVYLIVRNLHFRRYENKEKKEKKTAPRGYGRLRVNRFFLVCCVFLSVAVALVLFAKYRTALFSRATNTAFQFQNSSLSLIVSSVVPACITGTTALAVFNLRPRAKLFDWMLFVVQCFAQLIVCFPLGLARFQMGVIYIGLALVVCPFFRKGPWFILMMAFGLVIVFPLLDVFRSLAIGEVNIGQAFVQVVTSLTDDLTEGHYDAYTMFMLIQEYTADAGFSYGEQLLGVVLFWVPRVFWQGKPVGSGQTAAEFFKWDFTNLSCPLPAEGFVNFGIPGLILFAVAFALIVRALDRAFWKGKGEFIKFVYPFMVPFVFFLMRGDLLSSFAYLLGFAVTLWGMFLVNLFFIRMKRNREREARLRKRLRARRKPNVSAKNDNPKTTAETAAGK